MAWDDYLKAMGIDRWQLRQPLPNTLHRAQQDELQPVPADPDERASAVEKPITSELPESAPIESQPTASEAETERVDPEDYAALGWLDLAEAEPDFEPPDDAEPAGIDTMDWPELAEAVNNCTACPLHKSRTKAVFGVGNREAKWLIIGEAPGAEEDRRGEPFVGRAGKLLDAMLFAIGLDREQVFIANILKSRPPNNRDPNPDEVTACWPYLKRQIELIQPEIILVVGRIAAQTLLETRTPIGRLRGQVHRFGQWQLPLIVTYHPAYLLRSPNEKRKTWQDLLLARRTLADRR